MTYLLIALGVALVIAASIATGGILVGSARAGELLYLRGRVAKLETELAARPRESDVEHIRMDLAHLREAHATAVGQVIAMADASAHARLNPRRQEPDDTEPGPARSFDPAFHRDSVADDLLMDRMVEAPRYREQTEEEIRAEFEAANPPAGG